MPSVQESVRTGHSALPAIAIIPARYASSRFPGKPLEEIRGASGARRTLIRRTWEAASEARGIDRIVVATDDLRIRDEVNSFGGEAVMTPPSCRNGTERCAEAIKKLGGRYDIVVNVQGDAPLTPPWFIEAITASLRESPKRTVATPVIRCGGKDLEDFKADLRSGRPGATTAAFGAGGGALYFSKAIIPWTSGRVRDDAETPVFHHVGVYAYAPEALEWYLRQAPGPLETAEGLEQLRFLERGKRIHCVEVDARGRPFWEVNIPEDIERIESRLKEAGME